MTYIIDFIKHYVCEVTADNLEDAKELACTMEDDEIANCTVKEGEYEIFEQAKLKE